MISIIVPVYKVDAYLHRCVDSILAQSFLDFELILVDDGSPDECGNICDEYAARDDRIRVIHQANAGLSAARNAGMEIAQGEWFSFVDSDDYVHPKMIEALYDAVMMHRVKVSACAYIETTGEEIPTSEKLSANLWDTERFYTERNVNATVAWGKLYHRDCFREIRYPVGKLHEDEFVTYRILFANENIAVIDAPLYGYFQNLNGITKGKTYQYSRCLDKLEALQEQFDYFLNTKKSAPARAANKYFYYACHILYHFDKTRKKEFSLLRNHVKKSFKMMYRYLNRYQKIYFFMLRFSFAPAWILKHDFEPIQDMVRRLKRIK